MRKTKVELISDIKSDLPVKIIFRQYQSVGDILVLTAAIRELKLAYPKLQICMKTSCPEIWEHNPILKEFSEEEADLDIKLDYGLVNKSNSCGKHFIYGFIDDINDKLNLDLKLNGFKCDIYLSEKEKSWMNQVEEQHGYKGKFWLINCGHKSCFPLKQWRRDYWQEVINVLSDKYPTIKFVQVGSIEENHFHGALNGVISLLGKTDLRQLIRLAWHAQGVIGHVSMLNHLASAWDRPSIVVAGGRETQTWEAYNATSYLHSIGKMHCCWSGGCWKSKECSHIENGYPKCMNIIKPQSVINEFDMFYDGGRLEI
jgi:ADP-heptose:LPS heptosyltransferase